MTKKLLVQFILKRRLCKYKIWYVISNFNLRFRHPSYRVAKRGPEIRLSVGERMEILNDGTTQDKSLPS